MLMKYQISKVANKRFTKVREGRETKEQAYPIIIKTIARAKVYEILGTCQEQVNAL